MDNKKYLPIKTLHLVLMVGALLGSCYAAYYNFSVYGASVLMISDICPILAIIFGLYYFFKGYKKNTAIYYKLFMTFFLIEFAITVLCGMVTIKYDYIPAVIELITLVCISLLSYGIDLGKTKSSVLVITIIVCRVIMLISVFTTSAEMLSNLFANAGLFMCVISLLSDVLLAGSAGLMVYGKYIDKESRGTK